MSVNWNPATSRQRVGSKISETTVMPASLERHHRNVRPQLWSRPPHTPPAHRDPSRAPRREHRCSRTSKNVYTRPNRSGDGVMAWAVLLISGVFEAGWALCLKASDGFTKLWPSLAFLVLMVVSL